MQYDGMRAAIVLVLALSLGCRSSSPPTPDPVAEEAPAAAIEGLATEISAHLANGDLGGAARALANVSYDKNGRRFTAAETTARQHAFASFVEKPLLAAWDAIRTSELKASEERGTRRARGLSADSTLRDQLGWLAAESPVIAERLTVLEAELTKAEQAAFDRESADPRPLVWVRPKDDDGVMIVMDCVVDALAKRFPDVRWVGTGAHRDGEPTVWIASSAESTRYTKGNTREKQDMLSGLEIELVAEHLAPDLANASPHPSLRVTTPARRTGSPASPARTRRWRRRRSRWTRWMRSPQRCAAHSATRSPRFPSHAAAVRTPKTVGERVGSKSVARLTQRCEILRGRSCTGSRGRRVGEGRLTMTASKNPTSSWRGFRKQARAQAARLEKQAAATRLVSLAEDPLDALVTLWDLAAFDRHAAKVRAAHLHGRTSPPAPAPVSRLLSGFTEQLRDKCGAVAALLQRGDIERLAGIMSGFVAALDANDADVMLLIRDLLPRSPEVIAAWLRTHLESLETRFAS